MASFDTLVAIASLWAARNGYSPLVYERPDLQERRSKAVDLLGRDKLGAPRLVLEHTLVESYLHQRSAQLAAIKMLSPLEAELTSRLPSPGHFQLVVEPAQVLGLKSHSIRVRTWLASWIRRTAPTLELGSPSTAPRHLATTTIPNTLLTVSLYRWPRRDGELALSLAAPDATERVLAPSLSKAMEAKCTKLATAKASTSSADSMLLLEIADIALGDLTSLDAVLQNFLALPRAEIQIPDHIWLVDATVSPASLLISKAGDGATGPLVERYLPFGLGN